MENIWLMSWVELLRKERIWKFFCLRSLFKNFIQNISMLRKKAKKNGKNETVDERRKPYSWTEWNDPFRLVFLLSNANVWKSCHILWRIFNGKNTKVKKKFLSFWNPLLVHFISYKIKSFFYLETKNFF